jgi:hypothetical protein
MAGQGSKKFGEIHRQVAQISVTPEHQPAVAQRKHFLRNHFLRKTLSKKREAPMSPGNNGAGNESMSLKQRLVRFHGVQDGFITGWQLDLSNILKKPR